MSTEQDELFKFEPSESFEKLSKIVDGAEKVYVKKLSLNDWQWSENPDAHQGGPYIPHQDRDSGFFPALRKKLRKPGDDDIFEAYFDIHWPQADVIQKARLVHYTSKGQETHLTGVPKVLFSGISPASLVVFARRNRGETESLSYEAVIVDSDSDAFEYLRDLFVLDSTFLSGFFVPQLAVKATQDRALDFVEQALIAYRESRLDAFASAHATMPNTKEMARKAQDSYLAQTGLGELDPFKLSHPGDVVMTITRDVEYALFKNYELKARSMELVKIILGSGAAGMTVDKALRAIVTEFPRIDKVLLSAAQQRKSRAGYSFELHIERMLVDGRIPHEVQVVIEAKKRPDFVLPSYKLYRDANRAHPDALVLSAKTTLRERWKQVHGEIKNGDLYLATVDENIASNAIEDMASQGIKLVVPESLKASDAAAYKKYQNVLSFKEFFTNDIKAKRFPIWNALGVMVTGSKDGGLV